MLCVLSPKLVNLISLDHRRQFTQPVPFGRITVYYYDGTGINYPCYTIPSKCQPRRGSASLVPSGNVISNKALLMFISGELDREFSLTFFFPLIL